jgi:small subunit ribosomal protein S13
MEFKHIVRLVGNDLDGSRNVAYALTKIKGVNIRLAKAIVKKADIPLERRLGFLSDIEIRKIEEVVKNLEDYDLPAWLLNRRRDLETGKDVHLTTSDLDLKIKEDVERKKTIRSWQGYRHAYGLRVRGQKTRTTGRKGKSVGVKKKREVQPVGGP